MGRRNRNGNGGGRSLQQSLRRRVESCKSRFPTAEEIVNHLRSTYPEYQRTKYQTLVGFVHDALHSTTTNNNEDDDDAGRITSRKRRKKIDEALHLSMRAPPSTSSDLATESDDDENSETLSDLMRTMLRKSYTGTKDVPVVEEKATTSTMSSMVKGKEGPRFKDFGGMKEKLEYLMTEVLWPLRIEPYPYLPREVGVRPVTGILLHGPPGTGKTRLAHAIANETGLPFYHKSATEFVSGISGESEENIRELFDEAYRLLRPLSLLMRLMQLHQKDRIYGFS